MPVINKPYASGTPIDFGAFGTGISNLYKSITNAIPFISSSEPAQEGVYTDFLGDAYADKQDLSTLKAYAGSDRLITQASKDPSGQSGACAWYNVPCKVANKVSSVTASAGEFVQSTLTKTLIIITVAGVITLFLMSYVQTKGAQLAK